MNNAERIATSNRTVLEFIRSYTLEHGWAPAQREIADGTGVSLSTVNLSLRRLADQGLIDVRLDTPRAIRVTGTVMKIPEVTL